MQTKRQKIGPYLLIITLLLVITFIVGVRYGQRVEKANKAISYILSITPTKVSPSPQITANPYLFHNYHNAACGIEFTLPVSTNLSFNESGKITSIINTKQKITLVHLNCKDAKDTFKKLKNKTKAVKKIKTRSGYSQKIESSVDGRSYISLFIHNYINGKDILLQIYKNLFPLINSSLKLTK